MSDDVATRITVPDLEARIRDLEAIVVKEAKAREKAEAALAEFVSYDKGAHWFRIKRVAGREASEKPTVPHSYPLGREGYVHGCSCGSCRAWEAKNKAALARHARHQSKLIYDEGCGVCDYGSVAGRDKKE